MSRHRLFALLVVLAVGLLSTLAPLVSAQTAAERFEQTIAQRDQLPVRAGPFDFELVQTPDVLTVFRAGLDVADFVAHAEFTNPTDDSDQKWDYGFQFRTSGDNEDFRLFVVSDGTWNFSIGTEAPEQTVAAPNLNTEPGATNTLDLIVIGFDATLGINGEFAGSMLLPELDPTGDVYASTGFFSDLIVPDRVIGLRNYTVYAPSAAEASIEPGVGLKRPPARPVTLHRGSCADLGETVQTLTDTTYPPGEPQGQASAVVSETSFSRVPIFLDDLLAEPYAVNVAESADAPNLSIVCGDIGGVLDELGAYVIALSERNESGYRGVSYIAVDQRDGGTSISVFLAPPIAAAPADVLPLATPVATASAQPTDAAEGDATPAAGTRGSSIIEAEGTPAAVPSGEATPGL